MGRSNSGLRVDLGFNLRPSGIKSNSSACNVKTLAQGLGECFYEKIMFSLNLEQRFESGFLSLRGKNATIRKEKNRIK